MAVLSVGELVLNDLYAGMASPQSWTLPDSAVNNIEQSYRCLQDLIHAGKKLYGVNTGFGILANQSINRDQLHELQRNILCSHAAGVGACFSPEIVRGIYLTKINALAQGFSGVSVQLIEHLLAFYHADIIPVIPEKGSVGASGDLAPLAHFALPLIGEGEVFFQSERMAAKNALEKINLAPLVLQPKEGLALVNGTQVTTVLAADALRHTKQYFDRALQAGALSVEAIHGSHAPFDPLIHQVRRQAGQTEVASRMTGFLKDSPIHAAHQNEKCQKVQDPYCLRCIPQVMGACLDQITMAEQTITRELNAVTDNPIVDAARQRVISGGNFHAEPIAFAADQLAIAIAEIGSLSERRIALLMDNHLSGLPPFLIQESGINSGFMLAHVTAAALASENKHLAAAVSVDSLPTSGNQEDHVSMGTYAARRLREMNKNLRDIIAIELIAAAQAIEFHRPKKSSEPAEALIAQIRARVPALTKDRVLAEDIRRVAEIV